MDNTLLKVDKELKKYVSVYEGEHPLTNYNDAIKIGLRAGVIFRWAQNGDKTEIRWQIPGGLADNIVSVYPTKQVNMVIVKKIITTYQEKEPAETEVVHSTHESVAVPVPEEIPEDNEEPWDATPAARQLAYEEGIYLGVVEGTGKDGKITVTDVKRDRNKTAIAE